MYYILYILCLLYTIQYILYIYIYIFYIYTYIYIYYMKTCDKVSSTDTLN